MNSLEFWLLHVLKYLILCDCPEGVTVAPLHRYVWENHKFQNVISYDIYMKLLQTLSPKNNGKFRLLGATVIIMCYKALL